MTNAPASWWYRPFWPWSRLTTWQGFALSTGLAALAVYGGNRLFYGEQTVFGWLLWLWFGAAAFLRTLRRTMTVS